jgi:hypothetical protein
LSGIGVSGSGNPGTAPGGAGGGARSSGGFTGGGGTRPGGDGAAGRVIIEWNTTANLTFANNVTINGTLNAADITVGAASEFVGTSTGAINFGSLTINSSTPAEFQNNFSVSPGAVSGTGQITLVRNFNTTNKWNHIGWPVSGGATVGDLVAGGGFILRDASFPTNQINVYSWDAATSGWIPAPSSLALAGRALNIFTFGGAPTLELTISTSNFNNSTISQSYVYNDPGASPPGNATGWAP